MTRQLADALVALSELAESVADAAQQWLEAKDDDDREAIDDTRRELDAAMQAASEMLPKAADGPGTRGIHHAHEELPVLRRAIEILTEIAPREGYEVTGMVRQLDKGSDPGGRCRDARGSGR